MRLRRSTWSAEAARAAELGEFRHGHRRRNLVNTDITARVAGILFLAVIFLALLGHWLALLIVVLLPVAVLLGYMYLPFWDAGNPGWLGEPSRISVYAHGLVLDTATNCQYSAYGGNTEITTSLSTRPGTRSGFTRRALTSCSGPRGSSAPIPPARSKNQSARQTPIPPIPPFTRR